MRKLLKPALILLALYLATPLHAAAEESKAKPLLVLPASTQAGALPADSEPIFVFGRFLDPSPSVAIAAANSVTIFALEDGRRLRPAITWMTDERIGAMATADINGDGRDELATITADDGILEIQRFEKAGRITLGERRYLWSQVSGMVSARSQLGQLLVIVLSDGTLFTYHWSSTALEPLVSDSQSLARGLRHLIAFDVDGDLQDELVASTSSTQIAVLKFDKGVWVQSWQNYPWGGITGVAVGDILGKGTPQLFVTTHERMGYVYEYGKRGLAMTTQVSDLPFGITSVSSVGPPPPRPVVKSPVGRAGGPSSSAPAATSLPVTPARLLYAGPSETAIREGMAGDLLWRGRGLPTGVWTLWPNTGSGTLPKPLALLATADGSVTLYSLFDATPWRIRASNSTVAVPAALTEVSYRQGGALVSAREVATVLGGKLAWDAQARIARLTWPGGQVDISISTGTALRNGEYVDAPPAETLGGKLYFPLPALERIFGWRVTWSVNESLIELHY